jgi:hypothetical protein
MTNATESLSFHAPVLEGFAFEMGGPLKEERAQQIVEEYLGEGFSINPFGEHGTDFEVLGPRGEIPVDKAWELTYRFRTLPDVVYAEPLFAVSKTRTGQAQGGPLGEGQPERALEREFLFGSGHLPESEPKEWSLRGMRVRGVGEASDSRWQASRGDMGGI